MLEAEYIRQLVARCLHEDVGTGDLTAMLVPDGTIRGQLISRQRAVICGTELFDEVFRQLDAGIRVDWRVDDGDDIETDQVLATLSGPARAVLTGERSALNLLQTLSGTATSTRSYVSLTRGSGARILDTRKTIPGLRLAQKYAVRCGGGQNHRIGLFDGILIKENHLRSAGSITAALTQARARAPAGCLIEVEVESIDELREALAAGATRVLLDNFSLAALREAVVVNDGRAALEASGGIDAHTVAAVAQTGVDYVSIGTLTKDLEAVDFSLLFTDAQR